MPFDFDPSLEITGQFIIENPSFVYGLQRTPNQQRYEEMNAVFWSSAFASQGVLIEPNTNVLILQPTPLQVNTLLTDWLYLGIGTGDENTASKWYEVPDAATGLTVIEMYDATADRSFTATSIHDLDAGAGFFLNLYRSEVSRDASRSPLDIFTQVVIGDGQMGGLRVSFGYAAPPILELCTAVDDSGAQTWQEVARAGDSIPDCQAYLSGLADGILRLQVLPIPSEGAIVVTIGPGDASLVLRMDGAVLVGGPLTVTGKNGRVRIQYQPMRWVPLGAAISGLRDHGTRLVNAPQTRVDASVSPVATVTCEAQIVLGTQSQYALTLDATASADDSGLATATPVVRSVSLFFPGVTYNDIVTSPRRMNMKRVENERLIFDLSSLTFSQQATIICDNHTGQWAGASGYRAGYLEAGYNGDNWPRITGWVAGIAHSRNDPVRETAFTLVGKEHWLKRRAVGVQEPFDGWDIYAAIRFLAQLGGVTDDWLQALPYTLPGRGTPSPYYHLPVGTGTYNALVQFDPSTKIWDAMQQLARKVRGYLGFDCYGFLQFYKWSSANLGPYMQAFSTLPELFDGVPMLNQLKNTFTSRVDLSDVRSDVVLGAIDPFSGQPLFANSHNESVVTNLADPAFLGNEDTEIEINSLYFDPTLQNETLDALTQQTSLPGLSTGLEGYFQHRMYPLDTITVQEYYCLGGIFPFYVTGMTSNYGVNETANFGASQIEGRWLLNG